MGRGAAPACMRATSARTVGGWLGCGSGMCDIALHMGSRLSPAPCCCFPPCPPALYPRCSRALSVGCSVIFSLLPRTLQSVAPGSPPDGPVLGLVPCFFPPRMLQHGAPFFFRILSVASDAPVRGTGFTPDNPVRGLVPCFIPPQMLQSGASLCHSLSAAVCTVAVLVPASLSALLAPPHDSACPVPDAPVHVTGASAFPFPPVPFLTSPRAVKPYTRPALIAARFSFVCVPSGGPSARLPLCAPFPSLPLTALAANLAASVLPSL